MCTLNRYIEVATGHKRDFQRESGFPDFQEFQDPQSAAEFTL